MQINMKDYPTLNVKYKLQLRDMRDYPTLQFKYKLQ